MRKIGDHAAVLGASMAGLLAARVLADAYQRVTIVERDPLPECGLDRQGVPQGRHAHGLLARGHPGGPTGLAMVHEAVLQLRGEATGRQVDGARTALAHLVGGGSVATVNLLQAD